MSTTLAGPGHISLAQHETIGGHTIARHVAKTDAWLLTRLQNEPHISAAGAFLDIFVAEKAVNDAVQANLTSFLAWQGSTLVQTNFDHDANVIIGRAAIRSAPGIVRDMRRLSVIVKKLVNIPTGVFYVLTAFPIL